MAKKFLKRLGGESNGDQQQQQHGERVGQTVGDHRSENLGEGRVLPIGNIARAPHFAQAGKQHIERVSAQYRIEKNVQGRAHADGLELDAPAGGAHYQRDEAYEDAQTDIAEIALLADDAPHLGKIHVVEEGEA